MWKAKQKQILFCALLFFASLSIYMHIFWTDSNSNERSSTNPKSPFYGMIHRTEAGLVNPQERKVASYAMDNNWKNHMPHVMNAVGKYQLTNPSKNKTLFTNSFFIKTESFNYKLGQEFIANITSLDGDGKPKTFGGDYYRARLVREVTDYPDGTPCTVKDNNDGTYSVNAPLLLEGLLTLEVTLVITVEGVDEIIRQTEALNSWGHLYFALFESGEITPCNVDLSLFPE